MRRNDQRVSWFSQKEKRLQKVKNILTFPDLVGKWKDFTWKGQEHFANPAEMNDENKAKPS